MAIKTILSPYKLENNISFDIKRKYLQNNGFEIVHLSDGIKRLFRGCQIANLNFYESSYTNNAFRCYFDYIVKSIVLILMKIRGVKVIYTMHNKIGHDSKFPKVETRMMKKLFKHSDRIVVLCDESKRIIKRLMKKDYSNIERKLVKIPLVSYESAYKTKGLDMRKKYGIPQNSMLFTFIGGIRRYKNIELILEAAEHLSIAKDVVFLIAGSGDIKYLSELKKVASKKSNVIIHDSFIPNDEMADMAYATDVFLFPLELRSSLNSGSCMYAFSFGRNVICPNIGTIKELNQQVCYSYDYRDKNEHRKEFIKNCQLAYYEWKYKIIQTEQKQKILLEESRTTNSVEKIARLYKDLYISLI